MSGNLREMFEALAENAITASGMTDPAVLAAAMEEFDTALAEVARVAKVEAWDEGHEAGVDEQSHWNGYVYDPGYEPKENPYREAGEAQ